MQGQQRCDHQVYSRFGLSCGKCQRLLLSQERELESSLDSLKQSRVETIGRIPSKASEKQLRIEHDTYVRKLMKLQEAQSVEQMYCALLPQLDTEHGVIRKDLADMELACDKAERDMMQLQQQLKRCSAQHATAQGRHSQLTQSLHATKKEAHTAFAEIEHAIFNHSGRRDKYVGAVHSFTVRFSHLVYTQPMSSSKSKSCILIPLFSSCCTGADQPVPIHCVNGAGFGV